MCSDLQNFRILWKSEWCLFFDLENDRFFIVDYSRTNVWLFSPLNLTHLKLPRKLCTVLTSVLWILLLVFWIQLQHFQVSNNTRLISLHNLQNCKQDKTRRSRLGSSAVNWASLQSNTRRNESSPKSRNLVSHYKEDFLQ